MLTLLMFDRNESRTKCPVRFCSKRLEQRLFAVFVHQRGGHVPSCDYSVSSNRWTVFSHFSEPLRPKGIIYLGLVLCWLSSSFLLVVFDNAKHIAGIRVAFALPPPPLPPHFGSSGELHRVLFSVGLSVMYGSIRH
jgi:hypothetical protein